LNDRLETFDRYCKIGQEKKIRKDATKKKRRRKQNIRKKNQENSPSDQQKKNI
jgi:hypothetical protein